MSSCFYGYSLSPCLYNEVIYGTQLICKKCVKTALSFGTEVHMERRRTRYSVVFLSYNLGLNKQRIEYKNVDSVCLIIFLGLVMLMFLGWFQSAGYSFVQSFVHSSSIILLSWSGSLWVLAVLTQGGRMYSRWDCSPSQGSLISILIYIFRHTVVTCTSTPGLV